MPKFFAAAVFSLVLAGVPASAQRPGLPVLPKQQKAKGIPGPALRRFLKMSPEERAVALDRLPPPRRAQMLQRLERLDRMKPQERERTLRRLELFDSIPPGRRAAVRAAIQRLRGMPLPARQRYLDSDDAKLRFDPEEIELMREVSGLPPEEDVQ